MKNKTASFEPEWSRPLRAEKVSPNGIEEIIVATPREREALAARFDLIEVALIEARLKIMPKQAGMDFEVTGSLKADVVQRCVVTLEPLPAHIEQSINAHFTAPALIDSTPSERALDEEDREPLTNGIMDLGELVAQHLGLALDPYPRKPGLPPIEAEFGEPVVEINPFAKLVSLKDKREE